MPSGSRKRKAAKKKKEAAHHHHNHNHHYHDHPHSADVQNRGTYNPSLAVNLYLMGFFYYSTGCARLVLSCSLIFSTFTVDL